MKTIDCAGSSNIEAISYDEDTQDLDVTFKSGRYVYHAVTKEEAGELEAAASKGSYIAMNIRTTKQFTKF